MSIFWGSQTGTAEDFAETLGEEAKKLGFGVSVHDLEDYDTEELEEEEFCIFVMATYGEGEPTDNAKEFYDWLLEEERTDTPLSNIKYTIFGLGNTTYEHYNAIGRIMDSRLEELGAERVYEKGEGDDDSSLEEDFLNWKQNLWQPFCKLANLVSESSSEAPTFSAPRTKLVYVDIVEERVHALGTEKNGRTYGQKNPYIATVVENRELHTPKSDRSCRHLEIQLEKSMRYEPGDHLGVYPKNNPDFVNLMAKALGVDDQLDQGIKLVSISDESKVVLGPCTIREALSELKDLTNPPRKSLINALAQYAEDPEEQEKLLALSSTDESSLPKEERYAKWIKDDRRNILEIMEAFPSLRPPIGHFLEVLPDLAPRYYSISSSLSKYPGHVHITSVVVDFKKGSGQIHNGVCSNYFLEKNPENGSPTLPIFIRKSNFRLPKSLETPMIMIGPGTGYAPFRGFIQEREHLKKEQGIEGSEDLLVFGCRTRDQDFIYGDEIELAVEKGILGKVLLAFSREQDHKVYVQHKLLEHKELVWDLIENKNAHFYICGDAWQMAPDVKKAMEQIIVEMGERSEEEAQKYITDLQDQGRWSTDVW
eukprot:CAMPEP_0174251296 /NCGR_PEP_ID=MMETSP0439-20130205/1154_1 /TAXON_ID=0 /ORGANISM="Stereomyxa ramosa, Strain Chinc5" /LENGTH=593 /DNA_ID=CAMNT_0015331569 /DNA_START=273 /DNA_END=2051 /DNA_ORIENTATION=-